MTHLKSKHCIDVKLKAALSRESQQNVSQTIRQVSTPSTSSTTPSNNEVENAIPKKKVKISDYLLKDNSLEVIISRMTAKDGFSFNSFCKSLDLRNLFMKSGHKLPSSPNTIRSIVITFSDSVKANMINEIKKLQVQNQKFSLTFDEWTSRKNRRYLNINLHYNKKHCNLGLVRIQGSCSAEHCVGMVEERLKNFNLTIKDDIVAITTDGASMMIKVGRLIPCYRQLCYAHGIQLAIIDVLYKNFTASEDEVQKTIQEICNTIQSEISDDDDDEEGALTVNYISPSIEIAPNYRDLITKVRKVVKLFRKSPTKNDVILQKYVQEQHGKRLELIIDCKTRWNSLLNMLERFYNVRLCISKALIDLESEIRFTEEEWSTINDLKISLEPIKLGVEVLCRRDATLITAETTLRFILEKLDKQSTPLSTNLAVALRHRIGQRRTDVTGILLYLQNPNKFENDLKNPEDSTFLMPKKITIRKEIKNLLQRLLNNQHGENILSTSDTDLYFNHSDEDQDEPAPPILSLEEELEMKLQNEYSEVTESKSLSKNIEDILKKEMSAFENEGTKGKYLRIAYEYLLTIPPTSVEAERAFSAAGYLCSDLRTSLGDETINSLCFLRSYFQNSTS